MNLHQIESEWQAFLWLKFNGRNGHALGVHAYELTASTPPEFSTTTLPQYALTDDRLFVRQYFNPSRFAWEPFSADIQRLRASRPIPPALCGWTTRSTAPRIYTVDWGGCLNCARVASERGIIIAHQNDITSNPRVAAIRAERDAWALAGRPVIWTPTTG